MVEGERRVGHRLIATTAVLVGTDSGPVGVLNGRSSDEIRAGYPGPHIVRGLGRVALAPFSPGAIGGSGMSVRLVGQSVRLVGQVVHPCWGWPTIQSPCEIGVW